MATTTPILRLAFRPFFLVAGLFAPVAIAAWLLILKGQFQLLPLGGALFWHGHEMLFGFGAAVLSGFLLTAVQNWTGIRGVHGAPLLALVLLWLSARILMAWPILPSAVIAAIDISFLPAVALFFGHSLWRSGNRRNMPLVVILLLMASTNFASHAGHLFHLQQTSQQGLIAFVWLMVLVMSLISGRVMPMFTANGTATERVNNLPALDIATMALTLVIGLDQTFNLLGASVSSLLLLSGGLLHAWRFVRWRFWITLRVPLLWSLHLSYAFIPIGFFALAYSQYNSELTSTTALHWIMAGAMANMMLAMMARVSLGHSGRPLKPHKLMTLAFVLIALAGITRSLGSWLFSGHYITSLAVAAIFWCAAFVIFIALYAPIFLRPRVDGKDG